jgi:hypothetical protein
MSRDDETLRIESTRRDFLRDAAFALPAIAAADLLLRGGHLEAATTGERRLPGPHFEPKARRSSTSSRPAVPAPRSSTPVSSC